MAGMMGAEHCLLNARVVAVNIPGASGGVKVDKFLNDPALCVHTVRHVPSFIKPGAGAGSNSILVGSRSNFGATRAAVLAQGRGFLSSTEQFAI